MTRFLLGGAAAAALVALAPASAQIAPTGYAQQAPMAQRGPAMQVHTRAQLGAHVQTMFARLDTNRDGFITRAESQVAKGHRGDRQARQLQHRGNHSPEQRAARQAARFDRMDANRDGAVTRDEFARASAARQQRVGAAGGQNRGMRQPGAGGMRRAGGMGMAMAGLRGRMFDMADINRDTRVSLQEATAAAYRHFDMADANRDGQVTREERMQVRQQMRAQRRPG